MTISAARFLGPLGPEQLHNLEARVPEHTDPSEWLLILDQMSAAGMAMIKSAPIVPIEPE